MSGYDHNSVNTAFITVNAWFEFVRNVAKTQGADITACTASEELWTAVLRNRETGISGIIEAKVQ
jgi:hypothetical protein